MDVHKTKSVFPSAVAPYLITALLGIQEASQSMDQLGKPGTKNKGSYRKKKSTGEQMNNEAQELGYRTAKQEARLRKTLKEIDRKIEAGEPLSRIEKQIRQRILHAHAKAMRAQQRPQTAEERKKMRKRRRVKG